MPNTRGKSEDTHFVRRARSDNYALNEFAKCMAQKVMRLEADEEEKGKSVRTDDMARCFILNGRGVIVAALNGSLHILSINLCQLHNLPFTPHDPHEGDWIRNSRPITGAGTMRQLCSLRWWLVSCTRCRTANRTVLALVVSN